MIILNIETSDRLIITSQCGTKHSKLLFFRKEKKIRAQNQVWIQLLDEDYFDESLLALIDFFNDSLDSLFPMTMLMTLSKMNIDGLGGHQGDPQDDDDPQGDPQDAHPGGAAEVQNENWDKAQSSASSK